MRHTVNDGQWYFLAARWELGDTRRAYVGPLAEDGIGGPIGTAPKSADFVPWQYPMLIGASNNRGRVANVLSDAAIDEIKVYNYALTDQEIADAYNTVSGKQLALTPQ